MSSLEIKIQKLERKNRLLTCAVIMLGLTLSALFLVSAKPAQKIPDEIVAHSIRVVGEYAKNSAQLVATRDGFVGLFFNNSEGETPFSVMMTPSGKASIDFSGDKHIRLSLGVVDAKNGEDEYSLQLKDRNFKTIWQVPVSNPY
ncbi:MAG TPA: hypothetical protein VMT04_03780 [Terriglobales bacterium]|nr:hypothetical protein [Terriglobales bacterium]